MVLGLVFVVVLAASVLVWLVMWLLREEADEPPQVRVNRLNSLDEPRYASGTQRPPRS